MSIIDWLRQFFNPAAMRTDVGRRRLLGMMAVAPFLPWQEIIEEVAKPKIFYSIPPTIAYKAAVSEPLSMAAVQGIELEIWAKQIPDLILNGNTLYNRIKNGPRNFDGVVRPRIYPQAFQGAN